MFRFRSNDQLVSGGVLQLGNRSAEHSRDMQGPLGSVSLHPRPSEKKHVDMSFGSLEMATQLVHAKVVSKSMLHHWWVRTWAGNKGKLI